MKGAAVIGSGGLFLGPVHQAIPLVGRSTCKKYKSPSRCDRSRSTGVGNQIKEQKLWVYMGDCGVNSGLDPGQSASLLRIWGHLKGLCRAALLVSRVRGKVPSSQFHLFQLSKWKYLTSHITKPLVESRIKRWIRKFPEPLWF